MSWNEASIAPTREGEYLVLIGSVQYRIATFKNSKWDLMKPTQTAEPGITHWAELPDRPSNS